jgi:hypothetical protein
VQKNGRREVLLPLLEIALKGHPQFSGDDADWSSFERDWEEHVGSLLAALGGQVPDALLMLELEKVLDPANLMILQSRKEANPGVTCGEFERELRRRHSCDTTLQDRWAWENVQFCPKDPARPTLAEWRLFRAEFELLASRVDGRTRDEEHRLIFRQLPRRWQEKVVRAETRRAKSECWARVFHSHEAAWEEFRQWLEGASGCKFEQVQKLDGGCAVQCGSEELLGKVLDLHGLMVLGHQVRARRMDSRLAAQEIFDVVSELLRRRDALDPWDTWEVGACTAGASIPEGPEERSVPRPKGKSQKKEHPAVRRVRMRREARGDPAE